MLGAGRPKPDSKSRDIEDPRAVALGSRGGELLLLFGGFRGFFDELDFQVQGYFVPYGHAARF